MTATARVAEADRVELVYYWALTRLGDAMGEDTLSLWQQVPPTKDAAKSAWWLARLLQLMAGFRSEAHDLAVAYYRLVRALRTGHTIATGTEKPGTTVSLEKLREDFLGVVDHIDAEVHGAPSSPEPDLPHLDDSPITVEHVGNIEDLIQKSNDLATQEAAEDLDNLGIENLLKKLSAIDPKAKDIEALVAQAHAQAGNRHTAAAMRIMLNAARGLVYDLAHIDRRVIGWVRYSRTGSPCGWCAMLISRGVVYKSAASAGESDQYHDNCKCVAVPIFFIDQYDNGDLFALNHELDDLWQSLRDTEDSALIKQYGTAELLAIFRQIMRKRRFDNTPALAAAA